MNPTVVGAIDAELDRICREQRVSIRLAIESGSRAWGFPSPDSDYDCRFVYVGAPDRYLTPWPARDVIETPLTDLLDVNGRDPAKALRLLVNGNAVLIEWLMSPIVYRGDAVFRDELRALADEVADRDRIARHYLHLGTRQWELFGGNGSPDIRKGPALDSTGPIKSRDSDQAHALGLRTLLALADLELNALSLIERPEARSAHSRVVHEHVRPTVFLSDETEALLAVEPLHYALRHLIPSV